MYIRVLGGSVEVHMADGERVPLQPLTAAALGLLVIVGGDSGISRQRLKEMLWDVDDGADRSSSLKAVMSKMRKLLGQERVAYAHDSYRFVARDGDRVDLEISRLLVERADRLQCAETEAAVELYQDALALWSESPLAGLPQNSTVAGYLKALSSERQHIVESMIETMLDSGRHREVVAKTAVLVASDPLNERLRSLRMIALFRSGQKALALLEYDSAESAVMAGAGTRPGLALQDLRDRVMNDDSSLEWPGWSQHTSDSTVPIFEIQRGAYSPRA